VSQAGDRSSRMSIEDLEAVLASLRTYNNLITESRAVSVECQLLEPDWLLSSRRLFCVRKEGNWLKMTEKRRDKVLE